MTSSRAVPSLSELPPSMNWEDFNYPPMLRMWHYDPAELDLSPRFIARVMHAAFLLPVFTLVLNLAFTVVLIALGQMEVINAMFSCFNLLIGFAAGLWVFMSGYKGIAARKSRMQFRYVICWGMLTAVMGAFSLLAVANLNGWVRVAHLMQQRAWSRDTTNRAQTIWLVAAICEASLWSSCFVLSAYAWYTVLRVYRDGPVVFSRMNNWLGRSRIESN
eukprot:CAMPEP_0119341370 /NCGR_PEP_ID=MMETSP1333-20130426/102207_1 /TAXON_ID=418940 /ORGANISM="Scyphosphaera apsteinii, Strain RCC1455" /LENGTH=217 /DNA_ID=CAMNT_0007353313 /DNA_START=69 /DNA_END=722 /DNA_ORIENTATION=+